MECSNILKSRLVILNKEIEQRKHRAITHCNPCVYTHYSPSCTLVWDSIERHEQILQRLKEDLEKPLKEQ